MKKEKAYTGPSPRELGRIILPDEKGYWAFDLDKIICAVPHGEYSLFYIVDRDDPTKVIEKIAHKNMEHYVKLLPENFMPVTETHLVNLNRVFSISRKNEIEFNPPIPFLIKTTPKIKKLMIKFWEDDINSIVVKGH